MTIEEVIENREACLKYLEKLGPKATPECVEAVRMSIAALRDRQNPAKLDRSRWEGCPQCTWGTEGLLQREVKYGWTRGESVISCADEMYIIRYGEKDYALVCECTEENEHETEIGFCPFCGRPLTEAAWAEMKRRIFGGQENS